MKEAIAAVAEGRDLSEEEAGRVMNIMLNGEATQAQIGSFLTVLRMKGETIDELVGLASVLKDKAETISPKSDNYVDLVGTGGDRTFTFNISTTSAFVAAGAAEPRLRGFWPAPGGHSGSGGHVRRGAAGKLSCQRNRHRRESAGADCRPKAIPLLLWGGAPAAGRAGAAGHSGCLCPPKVIWGGFRRPGV